VKSSKPRLAAERNRDSGREMRKVMQGVEFVSLFVIQHTARWLRKGGHQKNGELPKKVITSEHGRTARRNPVAREKAEGEGGD